jgi:cyanophycin synthetase
MDFRKVLVLRGPNIWANFPVLEVWVDLGSLKDTPSNEVSGFNERLMGWLPTMVEHRCSTGQRGGFFERLRRGTYFAHILEHTTLELQTLAGIAVGMGRARETSEEGVYKVVIEYEEESVAKECLYAARELLLAAIDGRPYDLNATIRRLRSFTEQVRLGPSTRSIVVAARARGIPCRRLNAGSLVQLGYGARQRRICAAETDRTPAIAEEIAQDKDLTRQLLQAAGVPVPRGRPVTDAEDAWSAAEDIGLPVVVKPQDGNQGRGVATNLRSRQQVLAAYEAARKESKSVLVEKFAPGNDYRLLVVGGKLVAAARREAARVVGDGVHTIAELVEIVNMDPRRGEDHATSLSKIQLDAISLAVLADQALTPQSVPPAGQGVNVRRNANLSTGGTAIDVTDRVHPEVAARAIDAAEMVGLDVAGVDVVATEISRPLEEQGGVIVEVNAAPGLRMHLEPSAGVSRPVGEAIVATLFPAGSNGRIPIAAVTGVNGKTTTTRFIAHILQGTGRRVGMTCTDGIYIDDRRIDDEDCAGPQSASNVLMNPRVDAAVLETARGGVLRAGLGFDFCDVAVVTNIGEGDHLGLSYVDDLETLAKVKRAIVDVVLPTGYAVLNAADPLVAGMAPKCPGKVVFFARDPAQSVLAAHRQNGGRAIFVRDGSIVIADRAREEVVISLDRVPLTHRGRIGFQVENALAAIAAAWSLGVPLDVIRARVESFAANLDQSPGRFNLLEIRGATVVIDYGHNSSALLALVEAIEKLPHQKRTIVYSTAGDRRDGDIVRQGEIIGQNFDQAILFEDHYLRGRAEGEIIGLLRKGLASATRTKTIEDVRGAIPAVEAGLKAAQPGDLVVIQADTIDETVQYLHRYLKTLPPRVPVGPVPLETKAPVKTFTAAER